MNQNLCKTYLISGNPGDFYKFTIWIMLCWTFFYINLCENLRLVLHDNIPGSEFAGPKGRNIFGVLSIYYQLSQKFLFQSLVFDLSLYLLQHLVTLFKNFKSI